MPCTPPCTEVHTLTPELHAHLTPWAWTPPVEDAEDPKG